MDARALARVIAGDFLWLQLRLENLLFVIGTTFTYLTWRELQSWDVNFFILQNENNLLILLSKIGHTQLKCNSNNTENIS